MSYIIDRRPNGRHRSTVNRQRFLERYREQIQRAVGEAVTRRSITDIERGDRVSIPTRDIAEPVFHHGAGGEQQQVLPGNHDFQSGDRLPRPPTGGDGPGAGEASDTGEGEDDFVFNISRDEFLDFLFSDLALPRMVKRRLAGVETRQWQKAGIVSSGHPAKINIVRSLRQAQLRRIALGGDRRRQLRRLEDEYAERLARAEAPDSPALQALAEKIAALRAELERIPFIDTYDLRYNHHVQVAKPTAQAVMFCLMDVSGSMTQAMKDLAKRFFILLYLFLQRNYRRIEIVFIRHHTSAKEVDEQDFFYSRETGGTIVSSALQLMQGIIERRYPVADWNIYAAQASDGDNWNDDSPLCQELLREKILPHLQYYAYIEITPHEHQALWAAYAPLCDEFKGRFAMQQIVGAEDIYPVFRELFARKKKEAAA